MSEPIPLWEHFDENFIIADLVLIKPHEYFFPKKRDPKKYKCVGVYQDDNGNHKIQLSYFIGVDWISDKHTIYVAPKLNKDDKETDYLKMLFSALSHPEVASHTDELFEIKFNERQIDINQKQDLLTPLLVVRFLQVLKEIVRKGLKKSYYKVEQNLYCRVKGKVLVSQTIKQNLLKNKPLHTLCSFDEFGLNGLENRLLKKALVFVQRYLPTFFKEYPKEKDENGGFMAEIFSYVTPAFETVSEEVNLNDIKHTKTNALYKEYKEGLELARLILKRFGYNITNTTQTTIKTPPFWIDMSKLFELYVLGLLKESKFKSEVKFQFQANFGKPDFILTDQQLIIDTKYKTYYKEDFPKLSESKRTVIANDIRQVSGYARDMEVLKITGIPSSQVVECLIIYPKTDKDDKKEKYQLPDELLTTSIPEFNKFYKLAVQLPLIKVNP